MRSILISALIVLLVTPMVISQETSYEIQGKLLISFEKLNGDWTPVSKSEMPDAEYVHNNFGACDYRILDENENIIATGKIHLPDSIISEKVNEDGTVETIETPLVSQTAIVPLLDEAEWFDLLVPGKIVKRLVIRRARAQRTCPPDVFEGSRSANFSGFINNFRIPDKETYTNLASTPPGKYQKRDLSGHINVKGLPEGVTIAATMTFYRYEKGFKKTQRSRIRCTGYHYHTMDHYEVRVPKGTYNVEIELETSEFPSDEENWFVNQIACHVVPYISTFNDVVIDEEVLANGLDFEIDATELVDINVADDKGQPIRAQVNIISDKFDKETFNNSIRGPFYTNSEGRMKLRLPEGTYAFMVVPSNKNSGCGTLATKEVTSSTNDFQFILEKPGKVTGPALKQIWPEQNSATPTAAKGKLNILFMAEGYTDNQEKYTDKNKNGFWDGDYFIDYNGNGKFDKKKEIFEDLNRNGVYDKPEPFTDSNGDGVFNQYERARFEATASYLATGLLNSAPFSKNKNRIAIYTLWLPSKHATQKYEAYKAYKNMDTALSINIHGTSCPIAADLELVHNTAAAYLPDYTIPVVLIQDKQNHISANAMLDYGRILMSANDTMLLSTFKHEMGHSLGNLADEYYQVLAPYNGPELPYPNLTIHTDKNKIKWKRFIKDDVPLPTINGDPRIGLFIGAYYGNKGIFRPTSTSIMRFTSKGWGKVNEAAIKKALKKFK
jgi:hypothetical protein